MRVLITGGAGFIGSHLTEALTRNKDTQVKVLDNLSRGRLENLESCRGEFQFIQGEIHDKELLRESMDGASVVFHLAAQSNVLGAEADIDYSFNANVRGTVNILLVAREMGVRRVVFTSSREVYGEVAHLPVAENTPLCPRNAYGASKASAEHYCRVFSTNGLVVSILRLANVYGPRDRGRVIPIFLDSVRNGYPLVVYGGEQVLDFVWIDAVVDALMKAAFGPVLPGPLNIGSGTGTRIWDLAQRVAELAGRNVAIDLAPKRPTETVQFVADVTLARQILGIVTPSDPLFGLAKMAERPEAISQTGSELQLTASALV